MLVTSKTAYTAAAQFPSYCLLSLNRAIRSPALTTSTGLTKTFSTVDLGMLSGTSTLISSFIASRIETVCLAEISSPSETCTFQTFEAVGASMTVMFGSVRYVSYRDRAIARRKDRIDMVLPVSSLSTVPSST